MAKVKTGNILNGTVSIGGTAVGHILTSYDATETPIEKETFSAEHTPYPEVDHVGKKVEGTVEFITEASVASFPDITDASNAFVVVCPGFNFNGNVRFTNIAVKNDPQPDTNATVSIQFSTIDGSYTFLPKAAA